MSLKTPIPPRFIAIIAAMLRRGEVGVFPTDTIYGIVGSALKPATVKHIYTLRKRNPAKPMIILIGSVADLKKFGVVIDAAAKKILSRAWPGKVSVVLPIGSRAARTKLKYLHRGTNALAFRLPEPRSLRALLKRTGPLVAPSANFEGKPSAATVQEAKRYFGDRVSFYVDIGRMAAKPSTLIAINRGAITVLRKGSGRIARRK